MDGSDLEWVRKSAELARMAIGDVRAAQLAGELGAILQAFRALSRVDVTGVEPLTRPEVPCDGLRADEPAPSLPRAILMAAAPDARGGFYAVPKTVDAEP